MDIDNFWGVPARKKDGVRSMSIFFDPSNRSFYLESKNLSYVIQINEFGFLQHLYYGKRIAREDVSYAVQRIWRAHSAYLPGQGSWDSHEVLSMECPLYGRGDFRESMLAFDFGGVRVGDFRYSQHEILPTKPQVAGMPSVAGGETLVITLEDDVHAVQIKLFYTVFEDLPVILRHNEIINRGREALTLDRAYSFAVDLPDDQWELLSLYGAHLRERHVQKTKLHHGVVSVDSKYGVSSAQLNPFMALVRPCTTETAGEAYGFSLVYSGSFVLKTQVGQNDIARVLGGIQDYDFGWTLAPEEQFVTPEAVLVYSDSGLGTMSRAYHDLYRQHLINPRYVDAPRPIVLNSWEAVYMDFDTEKLCQMIRAIRGTGIDTFVLDDGWFGDRWDDRRSLGDWTVNPKKLPQGLQPVIDCAHENGLKFGIWFEPEMVNPDSALCRAHPDWLIHAPQLEPCQGRSQCVLDLTRQEVRDYIVAAVGKILTDYPIDYVKWDMNRSLTENYSQHLGERGKEFAHRYVLGLYEILERLVHGYPHIFFEGCASGGARYDPAMLAYFPQIWTSDNTDAYERCFVQYGTSMCYPVSTMSCHVSVSPNHQNGRVADFETRTALATLGATGYELDPGKLTAEDAARIYQDVQDYRRVEDLVRNGDLYRLDDPAEGNLFSEILVSKDQEKALLVVMRPLCVANPTAMRVYPRGLAEDKQYQIPELGLQLRGDTLMHVGLLLDFGCGDFKARKFHICSVSE